MCEEERNGARYDGCTGAAKWRGRVTTTAAHCVCRLEQKGEILKVCEEASRERERALHSQELCVKNTGREKEERAGGMW